MVPVIVKNLTRRFGSVVALDGVDLHVQPGEIFFLLGPSGCGKTTLLRSIAGFSMSGEGEIFFGRKNVTNLPPHQRETAMVFQNYALWPHMRVTKNVAFGLEEQKGYSKQAIEKRVAETLAAVQMEKYADRKIHELSGGQQQRVALARALIVRPKCLLLDEPLSNLDAKLRTEMRREIRRICREFQLTAIYVTHDQKEALSIADRIAVLQDGKIRQVGTAEELYRSPHSKFIAGFLGETNFLSGTIDQVTSDGVATVTSALGKFEGVISIPGWRPKDGEEVLLSIRPEAWRLVTEKGDHNAITGRVTDTVYLGEIAQHEVSANGQKLKIYELNPRVSAHNSAQSLHASVVREDVVVLPPA